MADPRIAVRGLVVDADIGIYSHEIGQRQPLVVSVVLDVEPATSDRIDATIDYEGIVAAAEALAATRIALIETLVRRLAICCLRLTGVSRVEVTVDKPKALASGTASASIVLLREVPAGSPRTARTGPLLDVEASMAASSAPAASGNAVMQILANAPMSSLQVAAVAISVALNALDGFDVLAITFAAPGITKLWGIGPAELGVALSSGLVGMSAGSLALAPFGDRYGRRRLILVCLVLMAAGMMLTSTATGLVSLCAWRVITGIGIGGMVATINAVASEFANDRRRDLSVAVMTIGLPLGGLIGGFAVANFIVAHGWQSIFFAGGVATAVFIPVVWFGLPESLEFLSQLGTPAARQEVDRILDRMGHPPLAAGVVLAAVPVSRGSFVELLGPRFRVVTLLLVAAYFLHMTTFYFFSGWLPKLLTDIGYATPDAIRTSAMMSLGGVIGGSAFGWAAPRFGLTHLVVIAMLGTTVTFAVLGQVSGLPALQLIAFLAGVCVFGGIVGLYALIARSFPAELRVTGTGVAIGVGRGGAVLGPVIGGVLIQAGTSIAVAIAIVGAGATAASGLLLLLRRQQGAAVAKEADR